MVEAEYRAEGPATKEWDENKTRLTGGIADLQRKAANQDNSMRLGKSEKAWRWGWSTRFTICMGNLEKTLEVPMESSS